MSYSVVIWASAPRARKQHVCENCGRVIDRGEVYSRVRCVDDDGTPGTWKECQHCLAFAAIYIDEIGYDARHDGYTVDDIREWDPESPEAVEHKRQWANSWHDETGNLYPVPTAPAPRPIEDRTPHEAYL